MRKFKIDLNEEEFFHLFSFYDKNMAGKISYNDFFRAHLEWKAEVHPWNYVERIKNSAELKFVFLIIIQNVISLCHCQTLCVSKCVKIYRK